MPLQSIEPRRFYRQIVEQIRTLIRGRKVRQTRAGIGDLGGALRDGAGNAGGSAAAARRPAVSPANRRGDRNSALAQVIRVLWDERGGALFRRLEHHYNAPQLWRAAIAEHEVVLKSIVARDAEGARSAMQRHLNHAYKRFSKGWNAGQ